MQGQTASIVSHNAVHKNTGFAPYAVVGRVFQLHDIATILVQVFSHHMITESAAPTNRCRNLNAFLQLPRSLSSSSLLLMMSTQTLVFWMP